MSSRSRSTLPMAHGGSKSLVLASELQSVIICPQRAFLKGTFQWHRANGIVWPSHSQLL